MHDPFPDGMLDDIDKFFALESTRKPGLDIYPSVFETALFFPLQRQRELEAMIQEARRVDPRVIMEIGADKGGGVYHWCKCLSPEIIIASEIRGTPYASRFETHFPRIQFYWMRGSRDREGFGDLKKWLHQRMEFIDVLFIDGDKDGFMEDFITYRPFMNPRGVVFLHDINILGFGHTTAMHQAFLDLQSKGYQTREIIDVSDTHRSLQLEKLGHPPANPHEGWLRHWRGKSCGVGVIYMPEHPGPEGK